MKKKALHFILMTLSGAGAVGTGCAGHNSHSDLYENKRVLVRKWVLQTHETASMTDRGKDFSNPVAYENTLIFGTQAIGLISLYPTLNQRRWTLPIKGGVTSELAIDKGSAYFGGGDGFFYSANLETGRVNWRYDVRNPMVSRPTVSGGRVFVTTTDDTVYAFDAGTGKWLWHYKRRTSPIATIHGASTPWVDGNEALVGLSDGFLVSLSVADGQLKWERKLHSGSKFTDVDAHPIVEEGVIYVPSYDGALYALKRQGGAILWRFDAGGSKQVVLQDKNIYLPASDGTIYALQKDNAKVLWKFDLDRGSPTQLVVTDQYVIVGSSYQYLYAIDKNTGKGVYRYNVGFGSGFSGAPAYDSASRRLYLLSGAGNLYAFALRSPPRKIRTHGATDPFAE